MLVGNVDDLVRHVLPIAVIHAFSEALDAAKVIDDVVHGLGLPFSHYRLHR